MASVTSSGQIMGTPLYMSPEQARGKASEIGPATDVWAIGLMAYRMLTGANYWTSDSIANLFFQILTEEKELPSTRSSKVGPPFDAWFLKSCALSPQERFPSVGAQVSALSVALLGTPVVLSQTPPTGLAPPALAETPRIATDPTVLAGDASAPSAATSTGVAASVAPSSPRRSRFAVVAAASVVLGLGGLSMMRSLSTSAHGPTASTSTDKSTSFGVTPTPNASSLVATTAEPMPGLAPSVNAVALSASVAAATLASAVPSAKTGPAAVSSGSRAVPRTSASHALVTAPSTAPNAPAKKPDLFDTQK